MDPIPNDAPEPPVAILILNWNRARETIECVVALDALFYTNLTIHVLDNGSHEELRKTDLQSRHPLIFHRSASNLGYAGGCNYLAAKAFADGADYVWFLNNDALVEPSSLRHLVQAAEGDPAIGICAPLLFEDEQFTVPDDTVGIVDLTKLTVTSCSDADQFLAAQQADPDCVAPLGAALLVRRIVYESIGGFEERFFAYYEDTDFCLRAFDACFRCKIVSNARVQHPHRSRDSKGQLPPYVHYYFVRNGIIFWRRHAGLRACLRFAVWEFSRLKRNARELDLFTTHPRLLEARCLGLLDGLLGRGGEYRASRLIASPLRRLLETLC